MQETWVQSLGWEDPLEKEMAVHLPGKSHGQRSLVGYSPWGRKELHMAERLFSSLSAIRVVSSAYLRLLRFLPEILILACASSSPAFLIMYSAYKLKKQDDNIQS